MKIIKSAAAKINLLLDLTGIFSNGYHGIYTVMQSVGIYDIVTVETAESGISLACDVPGIPTDGKNTAYKAAELFFEYTGISAGADIKIEKHIPSQAGMAGGSADAAAVLVALDEAYNTKLGASKLCELGAKIGADVPFCIVGGTALCQNIGELVTPLPAFKDYVFVCVKPEGNVSTAEAYAAYDALKNVRHPGKEEALHAYLAGDMSRFFALTANVFEQAVDVSGRAEIKAVMRAFKCEIAMMTGSGSAVYGVFKDIETAEKCAAALVRGGRNAVVAKPSDRGVK